ncbi:MULTISPECIES: hypothetical protein [Paraburkholderia]|uniref:hypothetical protein n=1 Tax=Paraburkholderia TaxID=1822464 RepID=UPI0038BC9C7C
MKRMLLAAGIAALAFFAGCHSLPTVQERFQTGCTIVNGDLTILGQSPLLNTEQQDVINKTILPANEAICKAGSQLNVADLKAFHDSLLPAAITIVQAVPAIPNQPAILLGLATFGPMVQALIDQLITTVAPASTTAAASK